MYEWKRFGGLVYCRRADEHGSTFFYFAGRYPADLSDRFWNESDPTQEVGDSPTIVCPCGSSTFTIRQESYYTRARCTECGLEESVHSG